MEDSRYQELQEAARKLGAEDGKATASWVFDGNTDRTTYVKWQTMIEEGDPEIWDHHRDPLSGEYADDLTPDILMRALGAPKDLDPESEYMLCSAYEQAHADAWMEEIERVVKLQLSD